MRVLRPVPIGLAICLASACAFGQESDADGPKITRADLATSYLRLEQALEGKELSNERTKEINLGFDQATLAFFQGRFGDAVRQIDRLTASLFDDNVQRAVGSAAAIRLRLEPTVVRLDEDTLVTLHAEQLYPPADPPDVLEAVLMVVDSDGYFVSKQPFRFNFVTDELKRISIPLRTPGGTDDPMRAWQLSQGRYTLAFGLGEFSEKSDAAFKAWQPTDMVLSMPFSAVVESLDAAREANAARLDAIEPATPALEQALAAAKARNALLTDAPSLENTAQMVLDLSRLANEILDETAAIENGEDPYEVRAGDYWRVIETADRDIPLRVYLPASADITEPLTLVIAFHGAGGDENMFMDAYGAGKIKDLADEHGFLLATPLTYAFNGPNMGPYFDTLIEALGYDYAIDSDRIFVLGHSMGGGAVASLVSVRGGKLAAAAALCGFRGFDASAEMLPPILVVAAELDPLAAPARLKPALDAANEAGHPVEYKLIENYGHTLVVGEALPMVIDWMFENAD